MLTYRLFSVVITIALASCSSWVQAQGGQFNGQNSSTPISQEEGRFLEFNNLVSVNFLKDSTQTYIIEEDETLILNQSKHYVYDVQGFEQYHVIKKVSGASWVNSARVEKIYNYDRLISERMEYSWDLQYEEWLPMYLLEYGYNNYEEPIEILEKKMVNRLWLNATKKTLSYSIDRLVEVETIYFWLAEDAEWLAETQTLFTYNDDDDIVEELIQQWNGTTAAWENMQSRQFEYDNQKLISVSTRSVWEAGVWIKSTVLDLFYNDKGQLVEGTPRSPIENNDPSTAEHSEIAKYSDDGYLGETTKRTWDEETGSWEDYQKDVHFWSEHYNGYLLKNENEINCQFANPYLLGLPWYCNNLKDDISYTIEVFDMWGRSFYQGQISNNASFRLSGNIPPGLYNVVIQGGLDRHTEKVLIRN